MSKEKQIEKMAKVIDEFTEPLSARDIHKADFSEQFAEHLYNADYRKQSEVAGKIIDELLEGLQYEIDIEDKHGRNAWAQGDVAGFQTHEYTEDKLETLKIALSLLKKKYTEGTKQ